MNRDKITQISCLKTMETTTEIKTGKIIRIPNGQEPKLYDVSTFETLSFRDIKNMNVFDENIIRSCGFEIPDLTLSKEELFGAHRKINKTIDCLENIRQYLFEVITKENPSGDEFFIKTTEGEKPVHYNFSKMTREEARQLDPKHETVIRACGLEIPDATCIYLHASYNKTVVSIACLEALRVYLYDAINQ